MKRGPGGLEVLLAAPLLDLGLPGLMRDARAHALARELNKLCLQELGRTRPMLISKRMNELFETMMLNLIVGNRILS